MENVHKVVNTMNKLNKSRFIDDKPEMVDNIKGDPFIEKMLELTDVISTVKFLTTRKGYGHCGYMFAHGKDYAALLRSYMEKEK